MERCDIKDMLISETDWYEAVMIYIMHYNYLGRNGYVQCIYQEALKDVSASVHLPWLGLFILSFFSTYYSILKFSPIILFEQLLILFC